MWSCMIISSVKEFANIDAEVVSLTSANQLCELYHLLNATHDDCGKRGIFLLIDLFPVLSSLFAGTHLMIQWSDNPRGAITIAVW